MNVTALIHTRRGRETEEIAREIERAFVALGCEVEATIGKRARGGKVRFHVKSDRYSKGIDLVKALMVPIEEREHRLDFAEVQAEDRAFSRGYFKAVR